MYNIVSFVPVKTQSLKFRMHRQRPDIYGVPENTCQVNSDVIVSTNNGEQSVEERLVSVKH